MKKWMYLIFPGAMLAVFLVFYLSSLKEQAAAEAAAAAKARQVASETAAKKKASEDQARIDAAKRKKEDDDAIAAREAKLDKDYFDKLHGYQETTRAATAAADASSKEAGELEIQLTELRRQREQANRDDFDALKQVELARVHERNAELDIQRMVEQIAKRASDSSLTRMPAVAPVAQK